jgi:hypothetical protein
VLGGSPENGPKYLTRSDPYHGLPDGPFGLATVFLIVTRPLPRTSDAAGERLLGPDLELSSTVCVAINLILCRSYL